MKPITSEEKLLRDFKPYAEKDIYNREANVYLRNIYSFNRNFNDFKNMTLITLIEHLATKKVVSVKTWLVDNHGNLLQDYTETVLEFHRIVKGIRDEKMKLYDERNSFNFSFTTHRIRVLNGLLKDCITTLHLLGEEKPTFKNRVMDLLSW